MHVADRGRDTDPAVPADKESFVVVLTVNQCCICCTVSSHKHTNESNQSGFSP